MKKIYVCSKLRGNVEENIKRAKIFSKKILLEGNMPFTPHIYFTLFLDDLNEEERQIGINASLEWLKDCDELWIFDRIWSEGMKEEINSAKRLNKRIITKYEKNIN